MKKSRALTFILFFACAFLVASNFDTAFCWSNGGYSSTPAQPVYGTHDWIAQHALDWLPSQEKQYLQDNLQAYLYGTELPDNNQAPDHIGDTSKHHVYFRSNGSLQEDFAAVRASEEYQIALNYLNSGDYSNAAKTAGMMSHYIADVAVFAHVMGSATDWGAETGNVHSNYESYVNTRTSEYIDTYNSYLSYDGTLVSLTVYDATLNVARDTTFDNGGSYNCTWMNQNYDTSNPTYWNRAGESLNLAVNTLTDVLHTLYISSNELIPAPSFTETPIATHNPTPTSTQTESPIPTAPSTMQPTTKPTLAPTSTPSVPETSFLVVLLTLIFVSSLVVLTKIRLDKDKLRGSNEIRIQQ